MKPKAVFLNRLDGEFIFCPFVGYTVNNLEEFKTLMRTKVYNAKSGYPGIFFSTKDEHTKVVFSGHQYEHGPEGRWSIYHDGDDKPTNWNSLTEEILDLFPDRETMDAKIQAITDIIHANGGIEIRF